MEPEYILGLMASGGGGAALLALVTGLIKWLSGASGRERAKNTSLEQQRRDAIKDRDAMSDELDNETRKRRNAEEIAHRYRTLLISKGIQPGELDIDITQPNIPSPIIKGEKQ